MTKYLFKTIEDLSKNISYLYSFKLHTFSGVICTNIVILILSTDKQNALRRECTFKIEIVLEIGMAGVNIYLNITVLTLSDVLVRLAQSVRP